MKIEKLNENKIRITLDLNDLAEKDIDFHSFMSNPIESQNLFLDMLEQAEKEVGFKTKDCKIMLEALAMSDGVFVITVTRVNAETSKTDSPVRKKVKIRRKIKNIDIDKCAIFEFVNFDDFLDFATSLSSEAITTISKSIRSSKLYCYNSKYYLIIDKIANDQNLIKHFCSSILEFGKLVSNSSTYRSTIIEHGKLIIKKDAVCCFYHKSVK